MRPLRHFLHVLHQTESVGTVFHHRFLGLRRHVAVLYRLLARASNNFRVLTFFRAELRVNGLRFTFACRVASTVRHCTTVIASGTPATVTV